jgi:hypothetical protein
MVEWLSVGLAAVVVGLGIIWLYARSEYRRGKLQAEKERDADDLERMARVAQALGRPVVSDPRALARRWLRRMPESEGSDVPDLPHSDNVDGK